MIKEKYSVPYRVIRMSTNFRTRGRPGLFRLHLELGSSDAFISDSLAEYFHDTIVQKGFARSPFDYDILSKAVAEANRTGRLNL